MVKLCWHFSSHLNGQEKYMYFSSEVTLWRSTQIDLDSLQENDAHSLSPSFIHPFIHLSTQPFVYYSFIEYLLCIKSSARTCILQNKIHWIGHIGNNGGLANYKSKFMWVNKKFLKLGWEVTFVCVSECFQ